MVIAGAGMRHEELVELTDKYFSSLKSQTPPSAIHLNRVNAQHVPPHLLPSPSSSWPKSLTRAASSYFSPSNGIPSELPLASLDTLRATYTGGYRFLPSPSAEFNHVYVAYESVGIHDEDIYTLATMQILLGGGGSFSAGGPGKGMYSRLYVHILNHFPQIDHCASFHHIYTDSSLFGLFASVQPTGSSPSQIMPHLVHQLSLLLYTPVPKIELERAKNQLKSSLMMALESRPIEVEDLGRQILVHGRKVNVAEMVNRIDEVTPDALRRVANRIFGPESGNKATVLCMGKEDVGDWQAVFRKYGTAGA
jgi:processing peptidase subunit alpha